MTACMVNLYEGIFPCILKTQLATSEFTQLYSWLIEHELVP